MSRNEIRLRRNRMSGQRFRNFGAVIERLKKIVRIFTTLLVILILIALIFFINQVGDKASKKTSYHQENIFRQNT
jgi:hypothetical protein